MITRKSARQAFRGGITASQIIRFLNMHAHPKVGCYLYILSTISGFPLLYLVIHPVLLILSILLSSSYPSCSPHFIHLVLLIFIHPVHLIFFILFSFSSSCSHHLIHPVPIILSILFPSSYPSCLPHLFHPLIILVLSSFSRILFSQYF